MKFTDTHDNSWERMLQLCIILSSTYLRLWSRSQTILTSCVIQVTHTYHCCIGYNSNSMFNDSNSESSVVILYGMLCLWVRSQTGTNWVSSRLTRSGTRGDAVCSVHSHVLFRPALRWSTNAFRVRRGVERALCHGAVELRIIHKVWIVAVLLQFYYLLREHCFCFRCEDSLITNRQSFITFVIFCKW